MFRLLCACALATLVAAGCGGGSASQQSEQVGSLAAEGAILAHDAAEGDTTAVFTRVHAGELGDAAAALGGSGRTPSVRRLARAIERDLRALGDRPGDEDAAARIERRLRALAQRARRLA